MGKKKISFSRFGSNEDRSEYSFITNGGKVQIIYKNLNETAGSNESISKRRIKLFQNNNFEVSPLVDNITES